MIARAHLLLALGLLALAGPAAAARVTGVVHDGDGKPVEYANISAPAQKRGAVTDHEGRFTLELTDGTTVLEVTQMGYQRARLTLVVREGLAPLRVQLVDEPVPVAEVTVAASSFGKSGKSEGAVVRRMDVYMTPGGAADIFQSLRALPGINAPNEGAALFVRGGDPRETQIRLDGATIGHPYHYESASGGLFSILDTYMLKSAFFSSGGFTAKYGGALSGVLDIETQDPMNLRTVGVGGNLASGALNTTWALVPDKLSFITSVGQSWPGLLFKLYGSSSEYEETPQSSQIADKLLYRYSPTGRLSLLHLGSTEHLAVKTNRLNIADTYRSRANNGFLSLQWSDVAFQSVSLRGNVSGQRYRDAWDFSSFGQTFIEEEARANLDGIWHAGTRHEIGFGAAQVSRRSRDSGLAAADSTDLGQGAPTRTLATDARVHEPSVYLEDKLRVVGPLYATLGLRAERESNAQRWLADPRAALAWRVDDHQTLRVATGRYHQGPDPKYLDPVYGNPELGSSRADHVIAGYEWKSERGNVRVEGYRKEYRALTTNDSTLFYASRGAGYARGMDVFVQGAYRWLNGWVSYGYLDSKRRELDDPRELPSAYGVRHSLTLVSQYQISSRWSTGLRYSHTSGRPFTPVVDRAYDATRQLWRPVYGEHRSDEMPQYQRLDLRVTRLFSLPAGLSLPASNVCVAYVEAMNLLGTANVLEYVYNSDYSQRYDRLSYFSRRLLVAGFGLSW